MFNAGKENIIIQPSVFLNRLTDLDINKFLENHVRMDFNILNKKKINNSFTEWLYYEWKKYCDYNQYNSESTWLED